MDKCYLPLETIQRYGHWEESCIKISADCNFSLCLEWGRTQRCVWPTSWFALDTITLYDLYSPITFVIRNKGLKRKEKVTRPSPFSLMDQFLWHRCSSYRSILPISLVQRFECAMSRTMSEVPMDDHVQPWPGETLFTYWCTPWGGRDISTWLPPYFVLPQRSGFWAGFMRWVR